MTAIKNKQQEESGPFGKVLYNWKVPAYNEHKRSVSWYLWMVIIATGLIIYSIVTANFLFALIVILVVFIVMIKVFEKPANLNFQITEKGIIIGQEYYTYEEIKNFYIIYDPPAVKKLFFSVKGLGPDLAINLNDINPIPIREKLLEYIDENLEKEEQTLDEQLDTLLKL